MTSVTVKGLDKVLAKVKRVNEMKEVRGALQWGGQYMQRFLKHYPEANREPNPILHERSERGRRVRGYFFGNKVRVPYKRTGNLRNRWVVVTSMNGMRVTVGNNTPYGPGIQDAGRQWRRHKHWPTIQSVAAERGPRVVDEIRRAVKREVNG